MLGLTPTARALSQTPMRMPNGWRDFDCRMRLRLPPRPRCFFQISHNRNDASSANADRLDSGADMPAGGEAPASTEEGADRDQRHKQAFLDRNPDPKIYAAGHLQETRSPYELMAGTVIPAALVTGINSDLPGQMIATVTQNVYDTVTGNYLLIPQGSRMLGQYDAQVAYGQRRVLLVWTRLIMPDGSSIILDRLQGTDKAGYSGLEDRVDSHWGRIFAGAALSTLLGVNAQLVAQDQSVNSGSITLAFRQSSQDSLNQVGQQLTRKNLNVQPTLTVRPGFPLRIIVNKDLILRPYVQIPWVGARVMKIKLGKLPNTGNVRITISLPATLKSQLDRYAELHSQHVGAKSRCCGVNTAHTRPILSDDRAFEAKPRGRYLR